MIRRLAHCLITCALLAATVSAAAQAAWPFGPLTAEPGFRITVNQRLIQGDTTGVIATAGNTITLAVENAPPRADLVLDAPATMHAMRRAGPVWRLRAPDTPGVYTVTVRNRATASALPISIFVPAPFNARHTAIGDYRIGHYQLQPRDSNPIYDPPTSLLKITAADMNAPLAPDFVVGQFLCHQQPGVWPKYLRVRPLLVAKLEAILHALREQGIDADTLTVMSGYRTPAYNAAIGNTTRYSRHLYGGAADIYVDTNHDGQMDDLNGDGRIDIDDARWLARLVKAVDAAQPRFVGGLSAYPATQYHGPFVHVDVRGKPARW